jgi:hypothetical protein
MTDDEARRNDEILSDEWLTSGTGRAWKLAP